MQRSAYRVSISRTPRTRRSARPRAVAVALAITLGILLPSPAVAQIPPGAQTINYDYDESSDGTIQSVGSLLLPDGYDPAASTSYPLVVVYHGWDEWGTNYAHMTKNIGNLLQRGYDSTLPEGGFFVYAPQAPTQGWNEAKEEVTMRILAKIIQEQKVDKARLYVTGLSNGGGATWTVAAQYFDIFSAAVPICGANLSGDDPAGLKNEYIWAFHARNDAQPGASVSNTRNKVNQIRAQLGFPAFTNWPTDTADWSYELYGNHAIETPKLKYREYGTGGHTIWGRVYAYDAMYAWVRSLHSPVTSLEAGETMLFDFGSIAVPVDSQSRVWNSIAGGTTQKTLLPFKPFAKISTGERRFVVAEVTGRFTGGVSTGGVSAGAMRYDADITKDSWVTANASEIGRITIRGLVPGASYDLTCFASAGTTNNGWITTYRAEGRVADLVVGNNATGIATLSNVIAKADGTIDLQVQAKSPATRGYIGALEIKLTGGAAAAFSQDFSCCTSVGAYVNASNPSSGQLNDISQEATGGAWSIQSGRLQLVRTGSSTTDNDAGLARWTNLPSSSSVMYVRLDIGVSSWTNSPFQNNAFCLDVGNYSGWIDYGSGGALGNVFNSLCIDGEGTDGGAHNRFSLSTAGLNAGLFTADGTLYRISYFLNRSTSAASYRGPDGAMHGLQPNRVSVWAGNALIFDDLGASNGSTSALTDFRMRWGQPDNGTWVIDNILIETTLPR